MISNRNTPALSRWLSKEKIPPLDENLSAVQKSLRPYRYNVYLLNSMALKIQHWFFVRRFKTNRRQSQNQRRQDSPILLPLRTESPWSFGPSKKRPNEISRNFNALKSLLGAKNLNLSLSQSRAAFKLLVPQSKTLNDTVNPTYQPKSIDSARELQVRTTEAHQ